LVLFFFFLFFFFFFFFFFFCSKFVPSARIVYSNAGDHNEYFDFLSSKLPVLKLEDLNRMLKQVSTLDLSDEMSHHIMLISPKFGNPSLFEYSIPTEFLCDFVLDRLAEKSEIWTSSEQ
jgi:hypothetical protein